MEIKPEKRSSAAPAVKGEMYKRQGKDKITAATEIIIPIIFKIGSFSQISSRL